MFDEYYHRRTSADTDGAIIDDPDPDLYIEEQAALLDDRIVCGLGDILRGAWKALKPSIVHHAALTAASISGADNEHDYYCRSNQ